MVGTLSERRDRPSVESANDAGFDKGTYGRSFADVYDEWYGSVSDAAATARFITRFGNGLDVLELGVGTGRLSAAVGADGHRVAGIDISPEMLDRVPSTPVALADMAELPVASRSVDVVLVATNTLFNLTEVTDQRRCLAEAERCVRTTGRVVVEAFVPPDPDPAADRLVTTRSVGIDRVVLTASIRDADGQTITGHHIDITEAGIRLRPWRVRYASPEELDAMAALAGLELAERHGDWEGTPFGAASPNHVSVYTLGGGGGSRAG